MNRRKLLSIVLSLSLALGVVGIISDSGTSVAASENVTDTQISISLNTSTTLNITQGDKHPSYAAYSFTTGTKKQYYAFKEDTCVPQYNYNYLICKNPTDSSADIIAASTGIGYSEFGDVGAAENNLQPNTTYYLLVQRDRAFDATVWMNALEDLEADTAASAEKITANTDKLGSIDGPKDVDVYSFETGENTFTLNAVADRKSVDIDIFEDEALTKSVASYMANTDAGSKDLSSFLQKNKKYYIRVKLSGLHTEGVAQGYKIKMMANEPLVDPNAKTDLGEAGAQIILEKNEFIYDGFAFEPPFTVVCKGETLTPDVDYDFRYLDNKEVGTALINVDGKGKYTGRISQTFKIVAKSTTTPDNTTTTGSSKKVYYIHCYCEGSGIAKSKKMIVKVNAKTKKMTLNGIGYKTKTKKWSTAKKYKKKFKKKTFKVASNFKITSEDTIESAKGYNTFKKEFGTKGTKTLYGPLATIKIVNGKIARIDCGS